MRGKAFTHHTRCILALDGIARCANRAQIEAMPRALDRLVPVVYDELRAIARAQLRNERPDHSLQATALVHEAYLRLAREKGVNWDGTDQRLFFHAAAEAMRRILIEHARKRGRVKRGGDPVRVGLDVLDAPGGWDIPGVDLAREDDLDQLVALDDAFRRLEKEDPRAADVVRLRFYAGLSVEETAKALGLSERTVKREWTFARAWLYAALSGGAADGRSE
jgi:RNA polymerase sigma factor (TIGR02999 family)